MMKLSQLYTQTQNITNSGSEDFYALMVSGKSVSDTRVDIRESKSDFLPFLRGETFKFVLCIMKNGYLGLVPRKTKTGDRIALLSGRPLSFIIRPIDNHYQVIEGCCVHGIMYEMRGQQMLLASSGIRSANIASNNE